MGVHRTSETSQEWLTTEGSVIANNLLFWDPCNNHEPSLGSDFYVVLYSDGINVSYRHDTYDMPYRPFEIKCEISGLLMTRLLKF